MNCPSCQYALTLASLLRMSKVQGLPTVEHYRCQNCQAEIAVTVEVRRPSPLDPAELRARTNRAGSHAP